ncbi:Wzz/FepE/Etk N-terminal domain-containing protein [Paucibacter sp. Y2R2-4]|uniref:Wzz/FepE/Etk N-terminal domain-containing protein n=1 Tax=Paucibacter sp. Y2R2-4 TaxID=2893553 RepID=UPI0021E3BC62|nr:Wzz/FepE/Etk N-terminal domain-containing protein [Paucibacter sp. Y2R2-4]MCV2349728.1 lipopolysaccharide biosynthesis protein [Paucibacter sp. Y2R2-4]
MSQNNSTSQDHLAPLDQQGDDDGIDLLELLTILAARWRLLLVAPLAAGTLALGGSYLIAPTYTAKTTFLPPQQQQSSAASALASLGALSGLAGGMAGIKSPADQYVALMQSNNVEDRIVDRFKLMEEYESKYRFEARNTLEKNVRISLGKKDGLITVEVDAKNPQMAADIANMHVTELRRLTSELALTEAQQRRAFFEGELKRTQIKLVEAQQILQSSGFNPGALKAEPKAAAEGYATLKAQATAAEIKLQTMRRSLADTTPEIQQQTTLLGALRAQLSKLEGATSDIKNDADYIGRYREYKYQETLFELFSKQFEIARLDESREGALIQVIDIATRPEHKSNPKRASIALTSTFAFLVLMLIYFPTMHILQKAKKIQAIKQELAV